MYSRQEAAKLREEFWTSFGLYMSPVQSAEGERINWINYKTGEKNIAFRMQADTKQAELFIELSHKDEGLRELYYEQFLQFQSLLHTITTQTWNWEKEHIDATGRVTSRIGINKVGWNLFKKGDWPELISFFKQGIIALDEFWSQVKYGFEALR